MTGETGQLLVPSALYGPYADARKAAGRAVTAFRKGTSIAEAFGSDFVAVRSDTPGLVVLDRRWSIISAQESHFHLDQPWRRLEDAGINKGEWDLLLRGAAEALEHPWAFAGLVGGQMYRVVRTASSQLRLLQAARLLWPQLVALGSRYTQGSGSGAPLEKLPTLVSFCLARQGAPPEELLPLTPVRLDMLLRELPGLRVRTLLEGGDVDGAVALLEGHSDVPLVSMAEHFLPFGLEDVACTAVERFSKSDPHGIVREWLDGRGNVNRVVR